MIKTRTNLAYGIERSYFDDQHIIGWTREGDSEHSGSGIAVLMSNKQSGSKWMEIGKIHAGSTFVDVLNKCSDVVTLNPEGWGEFKTAAGSVSVWVK
jgi:alpha-amylase